MTTKDICAGRKYTDKEGNEKTRWCVCGTYFEHSDGKASMKLDLIPTWKDWDGSFMIFDRKQKEQQQQAPTQNSGVPF